jgi:ferredoxin
MAKIKINNTVTVESNSSSTLLESMEYAGFDVEYNCREGHCGACRCKLTSGSVEYVGFAMAYTADNEVLPCICRAKSDVKLEAVKYHPTVKRA